MERRRNCASPLETSRVREKTGPRSFEQFEHALHERMMAAEREVLAEEMARADVDVDAVVIDGRVPSRGHRPRQRHRLEPKDPPRPKARASRSEAYTVFMIGVASIEMRLESCSSARVDSSWAAVHPALPSLRLSQSIARGTSELRVVLHPGIRTRPRNTGNCRTAECDHPLPKTECRGGGRIRGMSSSRRCYSASK